VRNASARVEAFRLQGKRIECGRSLPGIQVRAASSPSPAANPQVKGMIAVSDPYRLEAGDESPPTGEREGRRRLRPDMNVTPGHDAWVIGNEPAVFVEFQGAARYARG
jgi:hypothetical protein